MQNIFFLVALTLLSGSFILGQLGRLPLSQNVAVLLLDISVFIVVSGSLVYTTIRNRQELKNYLSHPLRTPLIVFIFVGIVSLLSNSYLLTNTQLFVSSLYLFRILVYYSAFFLVSNLVKTQKVAVNNAMVISGLLVVVLGYFQLLIFPDMRRFIVLGWDDHYYRMVSTFLDPNFLGIFYVLYFIFLVNKIRISLTAKRNVNTYFYLLGSVLTFIAIFLTYSRTAVLCLLVGMSVLLIYYKKARYIIGLGVVMLLLVGLFANTKYESLNPFRTASISARFIAADKAVALIKDNPVTGVGYNAYRYALERKSFVSDSPYPQHGESGTDNSFLFVTATMGILGLFSFLYFWGKTVQLRKTNDIYMASIAVIVVGSFFINAFFYVYLLLWMIALFGVTKNN